MRPWWHWWQLRDTIPVVLAVLVLAGFVLVCTALAAHLVLGLDTSFQRHWNHPR